MEIIKASELMHTRPPFDPNGEEYKYAASATMFETSDIFVSSEKVAAGQLASKPHYHGEVDEIIYILKGELVAHEGVTCVLLEAGDSVCFKANSKMLHYLKNDSSLEAEFLCIRRKINQTDIIAN